MALFALSTWATNAEMWFSDNRNGQVKKVDVQEGDEVFIVIRDNDNNIDCDVRDKFWTDVKIMDPKTGAYIIWDSGGYKGLNLHEDDAAALEYDYFEETSNDTGLFVSHRQFQIGTREAYTLNGEVDEYKWYTHVVDEGATDFQWGDYLYSEEQMPDDEFDDLGYFQADAAGLWAFVEWQNTLLVCAQQTPSELPHSDTIAEGDYMVGRFENMDTLIGMYQDPNDETDVATAMMKIIDTEATIVWDATDDVYIDARQSAKVTITDPDENVNCNKIEYVPFFVLVNEGSWNQTASAVVNSFCALKFLGGLDSLGAAKPHMLWWNIYEDRYIWYPKAGVDAIGTYKTLFDVVANVTKVAFFAQETGVNTGVFEYDFNEILFDLGFKSMNVRDVLVAYYLDPNDEDDFKYDTAYIGEKQHSTTSFTNSARQDVETFWIGRDPVYLMVVDENANVDPCCPEQVVVHICDPHGEDDAEWLVLTETGNSSPVFTTDMGTQLLPVWDALGVGLAGAMGGYQLNVDNWKLEVFNEDDLVARYNDVWYRTDEQGLAGLGDQDMDTAFPPQIERVRVFNDVSYDLMSIGDTQVFTSGSTKLSFLDRMGGAVTQGYVNSDCVFIKVIDDDQNEDIGRRERIDAYWDGGQNVPFGPVATEPFLCNNDYDELRCVNQLLGTVNIFNDNPATSLNHQYPDQALDTHAGWAKIYVLNPRSGRWAATDLLETGIATGEFVSVICIDLVSVYGGCVPTLDVIPGDTIVAFYQDPSNHSDSAMVSIKVGVGGSGPVVSQQSVTKFADAAGTVVTQYKDSDLVYVKVVDPSHTGEATIAKAVTIGGVEYDMAHLAGAPTDTFMTVGLDLNLVAGTTITANYEDPLNPSDKTSATASIIASELVITSFYAAPTPSSGPVTFGYNGSGIAATFSVEVRNFAGQIVWSTELANVTTVVWDGKDEHGAFVANGVYRYFAKATGGATPVIDDGIVVINR